MYKIKRFSSYKPARGLGIEKYYSEYLLEQREYGFLQEYKRLGLRKAIGRKIGKVRRNLGRKLEDSITEDSLNLSRSNNKIKDSKVLNNPRLDEALYKEAKDRKAYPFRSNNMESSVIKTKDIDPSAYKGNKGLENIIRSNDYLIDYSRKSGSESLAHEIGHIDNETKGGLVGKIINKVANSKGARGRLEDLDKNLGTDASGIKETAKRFLQGKAVVAEESNATKKGLNLLKKHGASESEMNDARTKLGDSLETYKNSTRISYKNALRNTVQIPSRKGFKIKDIGKGNKWGTKEKRKELFNPPSPKS